MFWWVPRKVKRNVVASLQNILPPTMGGREQLVFTATAHQNNADSHPPHVDCLFLELLSHSEGLIIHAIRPHATS